MLEQLDQLDKEFFLYLNEKHSLFGDTFMYFLSDKLAWIPFYALVFIFLLKHYRAKILFVLIAIAVTVILCDQFSSGFCKPFFERLRPSHAPRVGGNGSYCFRIFRWEVWLHFLACLQCIRNFHFTLLTPP